MCMLLLRELLGKNHHIIISEECALLVLLETATSYPLPTHLTLSMVTAVGVVDWMASFTWTVKGLLGTCLPSQKMFNE